ncbi:hypothetical protein UFOVP105_9 [uncultured Caudovirales phage]|uniref:Uncharacterized protein n=1 Tax=uncultured Caudovirales phage TaxID=2100421 RepID=A0A6J5L3R8_9CAUD|nr:hypothetical protein UFOVP105_9 [uncultured Caudovirales phage]
MNVFINFQSVVMGLFPYFLRKSKSIAFIYSLIKPLQEINSKLVLLRGDELFKLAFNAQIIYLEKYLNIVYVNSNAYPNNIHIVDTANVDFDYFYNKSEGQAPKYFYNNADAETPKYLRNTSELTSTADYSVYVPITTKTQYDYLGIYFNENVLINRIKQYNNAGKTFDIIYF